MSVMHAGAPSELWSSPAKTERKSGSQEVDPKHNNAKRNLLDEDEDLEERIVLYRGTLKHKILNREGLFSWEPAEQEVCRLMSNDKVMFRSITPEFKYAVDLERVSRVDSSSGSCRFDIVFVRGGRSQSFLAPTNVLCQEWVSVMRKNIKPATENVETATIPSNHDTSSLKLQALNSSWDESGMTVDSNHKPEIDDDNEEEEDDEDSYSHKLSQTELDDTFGSFIVNKSNIKKNKKSVSNKKKKRVKKKRTSVLDRPTAASIAMRATSLSPRHVGVTRKAVGTKPRSLLNASTMTSATTITTTTTTTLTRKPAIRIPQPKKTTLVKKKKPQQDPRSSTIKSSPSAAAGSSSSSHKELAKLARQQAMEIADLRRKLALVEGSQSPSFNKNALLLKIDELKQELHTVKAERDAFENLFTTMSDKFATLEKKHQLLREKKKKTTTTTTKKLSNK